MSGSIVSREDRIIIDQRRVPSPLISFIVPVFNEKKTIRSVLDVLAQFPFPHEIIIVDDGSTDGTRDVLRELTLPGVMVLFHDRNRGKGAALQTGAVESRGRFVAIQDADLEYNPLEYVVLLQKAVDENLRVVFGSRFLRQNPAIYWRFWLGNKVMTFWINVLTGAGFTDSYTCFKLISKDLLMSLDLVSSGFEIEAEICVKVAQRTGAILEVPIHYQPRRLEEGKKIRARDAFKGAMTAASVRFPRVGSLLKKLI